jgi:hypothetical protein
VNAPDDIPVEPAEGALSSAFPIGPNADDSYRYYDPTTQSVVPIDYRGTDEREGRSVDVYDISATGPVEDPGLLEMLPPALAKSLLPGLAEILMAQWLRPRWAQPVTRLAVLDPIDLMFATSEGREVLRAMRAFHRALHKLVELGLVDDECPFSRPIR